MRKIVNFNRNWLFSKTAEIPADLPSGWEEISLPHTWNAVDGQDGGNDYWRGTAVYCKEFERPTLESGGRAVLEFLGAAMTADVYVNGQRLAHHEGGYSTFRVDITDALQGENLLCVAVDNSNNDRVYPQKADFTFYGGLYRSVNLILVPENHFELCRDGAPGIKVTPVVRERNAAVTVETWQNGEGSVTMTVAGMKKTVPSESGHAAAEFVIENVRLWNGIEDPYLYEAKAEYGGDEIRTGFGCRTIGFDPEKGFLLNGSVYPLRGVSRHQDRKGLGNAITIREHREDMEFIREIGANTVRLAHYQHAQEFYDLCDEYGIIAWAEIPYITQHMPNGRENTLSQMRELIAQCYNHPSIVCWGLSNEITASGPVSEDLLDNHRALNDLCHAMDKTRPTTMAHVFMLEQESELIPIADIGSYNLYFGWYLGELEQNDTFFDEYHRKYPNRVIGFSEYGADANPQYQSAHPEKGDYSESYQCVYHEHILKCIEARPYLWATHVWNLFDFAADGRDEGGKHGENQKGLVTFDRKLRKDAFYLYKAYWSKEPFVHLCGRRYADRTEEVTEIKVYSNRSEVTLLVDGEEVASGKDARIYTFRVPITGEHTVEVRSGSLSDRITIRKAEKANPDYRMAGGEVVNWFDADKHDPTCFSIKDTLGTLMRHPQTAAIVGRMMQNARASRGDVAQAAAGNANLERMMAGMTLQSLLKQAGPAIKPEQIRALNAALQQIKK
ncbi:MAG: glycoside hydrolase family 2 TIM barrel-domain containing protein [Candidatus Faecousia sp.]|nr:glycoside hydrolase family 2 TIM barrel-domain containing protein [Candidatus Faecousia sp.]